MLRSLRHDPHKRKYTCDVSSIIIIFIIRNQVFVLTLPQFIADHSSRKLYYTAQTDSAAVFTPSDLFDDLVRAQKIRCAPPTPHKGHRGCCDFYRMVSMTLKVRRA